MTAAARTDADQPQMRSDVSGTEHVSARSETIVMISTLPESSLSVKCQCKYVKLTSRLVEDQNTGKFQHREIPTSQSQCQCKQISFKSNDQHHLTDAGYTHQQRSTRPSLLQHYRIEHGHRRRSQKLRAGSQPTFAMATKALRTL